MTSRLASAAKAELSSEAFQQAIIRLEEKWLDEIRNSEPERIDRREIAYRMLKTLEDFVNELAAMASDEAHARGRAEAEQMTRQ